VLNITEPEHPREVSCLTLDVVVRNVDAALAVLTTLVEKP
jgi:hypothetical protein